MLIRGTLETKRAGKHSGALPFSGSATFPLSSVGKCENQEKSQGGEPKVSWCPKGGGGGRDKATSSRSMLRFVSEILP